ncbi:MAG: hypothetical protein PHN82_03110 [bacterium]|nr:hypothetical protein [bacterium]
MNACIILVSCAAWLAASPTAPVGVQLHDVNRFPELYKEEALIEIDNVTLGGTIRRDENQFCLDISERTAERTRGAQERGEWAPAFLSKQRANFVAPPSLARALSDELSLGEARPARIRCTVERAEFHGEVYWLALVHQVDLIDEAGAVAKTLGELPPTPVPEAAATATPEPAPEPAPTEESAAYEGDIFSAEPDEETP